MVAAVTVETDRDESIRESMGRAMKLVTVPVISVSRALGEQWCQDPNNTC